MQLVRLIIILGGLTAMNPPQILFASELSSPLSLPDPLAMSDGSRATTADQWREKRRPELQELFEHYMYGRYPRGEAYHPQSPVDARFLFEDKHAFDGLATLRELELTIGPPEWPKIYLLLATPNATPRAPCFVGMNFGGNHLLLDDPRIRLSDGWMPEHLPGTVDHRATETGRGAHVDVWPMEQIVKRGYAVGVFYCGDVQPDRPFEREGMRATLAASTADDRAEAADGETATIMWWGWGIHRVIDYLTTDGSIDPARIAVAGHSRLGKTALVAGAWDERVALVVANQAGCGGSGPSRHDDPQAETVKIITKNFPHWFAGNFAKFAEDPSRLPIDQNCLVALCAPRPVLFTAAADDEWANPTGQLAVLQAASPVYELLGVAGLKAESMPKADAPLLSEGRLGYWFRAGEHSMTPADWNVYMDFADRQLK